MIKDYLITFIVTLLIMAFILLGKVINSKKNLKSGEEIHKEELLKEIEDLKSKYKFTELWYKDGLINKYSYTIQQQEIVNKIEELEKELGIYER